MKKSHYGIFVFASLFVAVSIINLMNPGRKKVNSTTCNTTFCQYVKDIQEGSFPRICIPALDSIYALDRENELNKGISKDTVELELIHIDYKEDRRDKGYFLINNSGYLDLYSKDDMAAFSLSPEDDL